MAKEGVPMRLRNRLLLVVVTGAIVIAMGASANAAPNPQNPPVVTVSPNQLTGVYNAPMSFTITVTDPDGPATPTCRVGTAPANGVVVLNDCTSGTYQSDLGFVGTNSFTIVANDGMIDSLPATVNVSVLWPSPTPTFTPTTTLTPTPTPTNTPLPTFTPTGALTLLSTDSAGVKANLGVRPGFGMSDDGSKVIFDSQSSNLVSPAPPSGRLNVYVKDVASDVTTLVAEDAYGNSNVAISRNGRFVAFASHATNLDPADTDTTPDLYVKDLLNGTIRLVSTNSAGVKGNHTAVFVGSVSNDGTVVIFATNASNFDPRHTAKTCTDPDSGMPYNCTELEIYLKNLTNGAVTLLTAGDNGRDAPGGSLFSAISADGSKVFLSTRDSLTPEDTDNSQADVYLYNVPDGTYTLVSTDLPSGMSDSQNVVAYLPYASADGRRVVFQGGGSAWPPFDGSNQVYLKDLDTGLLELVSTNGHNVAANNLSQDPVISGDGIYVSFSSNATNLDPADTDTIADIYLKNLATGALTFVSQTDNGTKANQSSFISAPVQGGGAVIFASDATNLDPADTDLCPDLYRKTLTAPSVIITDSLQPPGTPDGSFLDSSLSPPTSGSIVNPAGLEVTITDAPDLVDGVQITVGPGRGRASFSVCNGFLLRVSAGSTVVVTCGSVTVKTLAGLAEIVLGGGITLVSIPPGGEARINNSGGDNYIVVNQGTIAVTVTLDGVSGTVSPGSSSPLVTWHFIGFSQPVDNQPVMNKMKAGQTVPIKWRLLNSSGAPVTNLAIATITVTSLNCSSGTTVDLVEETVAGSSGLQNLGNGYYQMNWKSPKMYADSCKTLSLNINDGVSHDANFQFTH